MIIRNEEHKRETIENVRGGKGGIHFKRIIQEPGQLYNKGSVFSVMTLEKDSEVGWHIHKGDGEYYYVLSGQAEYSDNGNIVTLSAGDTAFCPDGEGHYIANRGSEPLVLLALVIYN